MSDYELLETLFLMFQGTGHYKAIVGLRGKTPLNPREQADIYFVDTVRRRLHPDSRKERAESGSAKS